jgi:S-adenosylmethionine:tRNA ribosyltransferase-isomerase
MNNAKVTPARLYGLQQNSKVEVLILNPPTYSMREGIYELWCLVYPGKKFKVGSEIIFKGSDCDLTGKVVQISQSGHRLIRFNFSDSPVLILEKLGHIPLPHYIKRPAREEDTLRYQTVYASDTNSGAIAAPTAGLHFTLEQLDRLKAKGFDQVFVHLRVGAGTFQPLTEERLETGKLHKEYVDIDPLAATEIRGAKLEGKSIISVGTTTLRAIEWASLEGELLPKSGFTDIFIRPGFKFKVADGLITNFHLPCSSLLILVSAFAGLENIKRAYELAIQEKFRFYSYGDAMLII